MTACSENNGSGIKTCNSSGTGFGACQLNACNNGYTLQGGVCTMQKTLVKTTFGLVPCSLFSNGELQCSGYNSMGAVGNGKCEEANDTFSVFTSGVTDAASGIMTTCAVVSGSVYCWGRNDWDQATARSGDTYCAASSSPIQYKPFKITLPGPATAVEVSGITSCALVNGAMICWGKNIFGVNPGTIISSGVTQFVKPRVYTESICAIVDGTTRCW